MFDVTKLTGRNYVNPNRPTLDTGPGLTKQSPKDETDINLIMAKYQKTGLISFGQAEAGEYMNVQVQDFQTAMDTVMRANEMFAAMPSSHRKRFENNPEKFLEFVNDPANLDEAAEMGLLKKVVDPGPDKIAGTPDDIVTAAPPDPKP